MVRHNEEGRVVRCHAETVVTCHLGSLEGSHDRAGERQQMELGHNTEVTTRRCRHPTQPSHALSTRRGQQAAHAVG